MTRPGAFVRPAAAAALALLLSASVAVQERDRAKIPDKYKWDLTKIYPSDDWNRQSGGNESRRWLHDVFLDLRGFVQHAAGAGDGLVIHIS